MNAVERVEERLKNAMDGLLREFEADETEPVDCEFIIHIGSQGLVDISGGELKAPSTPASTAEPKVVKRK